MLSSWSQSNQDYFAIKFTGLNLGPKFPPTSCQDESQQAIHQFSAKMPETAGSILEPVVLHKISMQLDSYPTAKVENSEGFVILQQFSGKSLRRPDFQRSGRFALCEPDLFCGFWYHTSLDVVFANNRGNSPTFKRTLNLVLKQTSFDE